MGLKWARHRPGCACVCFCPRNAQDQSLAARSTLVTPPAFCLRCSSLAAHRLLRLLLCSLCLLTRRCQHARHHGDLRSRSARRSRSGLGRRCWPGHLVLAAVLAGSPLRGHVGRVVLHRFRLLARRPRRHDLQQWPVQHVRTSSRRSSHLPSVCNPGYDFRSGYCHMTKPNCPAGQVEFMGFCVTCVFRISEPADLAQRPR